MRLYCNYKETEMHKKQTYNIKTQIWISLSGSGTYHINIRSQLIQAFLFVFNFLFYSENSTYEARFIEQTGFWSSNLKKEQRGTLNLFTKDLTLN